jgi:hypothetical protein
LGHLIILFIIFSHLIGLTSLFISSFINSPSLDPISVSINLPQKLCDTLLNLQVEPRSSPGPNGFPEERGQTH